MIQRIVACVFLLFIVPIAQAEGLGSSDEREEYHDQYRGASSASEQLVKINERDLEAVFPGGNDGCGKWDVIGICLKVNPFREGPIIKPMWSYYYTDLVIEANRRPTGSVLIPKFLMQILSYISYPLLANLGPQQVTRNMQHYSEAQVTHKIPTMGQASSEAGQALMNAYNEDLHFGAPHQGLFQNAMQSGSDRLFDQVFLYNNIWSPFTMVHKYQRNTRPADKRDASSRQYVAPYIAISLENVMFHFYEATSQFNDYYKERAFKREEPRNCLGTQMEAAPQNQEKPLERFMEHQAAGHVNTQSTNDQLTCMGSGYTYWTVAGPGGDTVYAAQLAAPAAVVGWDAINSRVLEKQEPTQQLIEQYDYIQFIKPYFEYKKDEIKGDPSHFLGHMPNPDDLPKDSPNAGWPKGCRDRYVEDKQIGPQSHTASPKHDFNTDYIAASTVLKGKSPANHYVLTGWTNVWGCPYDYAPLGEKDGEIEKLS